MTFTSDFFLIGLLPWFLIFYNRLRKNEISKKILILIGNIIFYIWGGIQSFFFICLICFTTWLFCIFFRTNKKRILFCIACLILLVPMLSVKYIGFLINNINTFFSTNIFLPPLPVPIGISFFTFEAISCVSDVYQNKTTEDIKILDIFLYLSFFPTIVSGPIIRISNFKEGYIGINTPETLNSGVERIAIGLCKKILIADKIAMLANYYFNGVEAGNIYSVMGLWIGSIAYTLQLYFDFSGYSDMAIGISRLMGFHVPENFCQPYLAGSVQEFWRRWHISLSSWFRDYLYIPLGGNRCTVVKHIRNMLIVWFLTGLWHGADWSFVIWGMGYFLLLIVEKYIACMKNIGKHWYGHIYTLFFVNLLWVPFRTSNLSVAVKYIGGMFGVGTKDLVIERKALRFLPFLIMTIILCLPWNIWLNKFINTKWLKCVKNVIIPIMAVFAVCAVMNSSYEPYIYGNF